MRYIFLIVCFLIGVNGFSQSTYNCIYDDLNRLTEVQYGNGTTIQYQYDKVGNRISKIINGVTNNQPDIIPTNGNLSLSSVGIGSDVTLTFLNENIGTASTGSFNTLIVLSDNATYEAGVDEVLATLYTSNLVAGAMPSVSQVLTIPNNVSTGSKNIIIISDVDDDVSNELAETNNELVLNITLVDCNGLTATVTPTDETCDDDNGAASVSANNGAAPYSYTWNSSPPQTGTSASNLSSGNYEVSVLDQNGCEVISAFTINNVGDDPIANFNFSPFNLNVNFTSTSLYGTSYVWDFGDGNSSTLTNPNHTYSSNGTYSVCLDVTNSCGTDQYCTNVLISGNSCDIPIGLSSSNNTPTSVTLSWNNVSGANSYNLRYKETGATTWNNSTIAPPLVTLNGLQAGTAYEFQVEAVCSSGGSTYSSSSYFNTNAGGGSTSADEFFLVYEHPSQSLLGRDLFKTSTGHYITSELNHIVKHDSLGEIEWVKKYEIGSTTFYIESTIETADGGYVAVGDYTVSGNTDMFVLKLDINGAVQWAKTYGDADDDYGRSIIQDASGNYVCIGYTRGYGAGSADAMVIKLDSTGDIIWSKRYGNSMFGVGLHVIEASGGGYIMLGRHTEIIPLNPGSAVANTMDIWKLSTSGALVWKKTYHPLDHTHDYDVSRIFQNSDGNIYMCGNFNNGERRGLVVKFNSAGDIQWGKYMSSPFEDDRLFSIGIDSNGDVLAMGETNVSSSSQEDVSVYKLSANNGNLLGAYYIFANDDQFSFGGLIDGDYLVATGQTEDFGTDNNDDAFLIRRKTDFSNTCQGNSFTPTTGSISTGIATFNFTGDITMTTVTQSITVSIPTISTIYPCGGGCQTIASITTSSSTICQDETISFYSTSTNAIDYKWEIDGVQFSTIANPTYTFNTAGTFNISLTVTDGASCSDQTSIQVISHPLPSISINTTNEQCSGADGTATVDVSAVTSPQILWSNGSTSSTISNLSAGNYGVLVTDINGCTTNQNFSINNSSNGFTISSIVEDVTCSGASDGRIIITPSGTVGNITYTWTGGTLTNYSAIKMDFDSNLTTDFIQLYGDFDQADQYLVGDWNGDGKDNIAYRIGQNIYMDFDYDHIPDFTQNYGTGNTEDDYIVGDWDGDGSDNIAVVRGFEVWMDYDFDNNHDYIQTYGTGNTFDKFLVGDWDGNGTDNLAYRVGNTIYMDFDFNSIPDLTQNFGNGNSEDDYLSGDWNGDGTDNLALVRGDEVWMNYNFDSNHDYIQTYGTGFSFDQYYVGDWDGNGTSNLAYIYGKGVTSLSSGNYDLTISDAAGCSNTENFTIDEPNPITVVPSANPETTCNASNGTITLSTTGGTLPYSYSWSSGQTTSSIIGLSPGTYTVTVTDANNCSETTFANINSSSCGIVLSSVSKDSIEFNFPNGFVGSSSNFYIWSRENGKVDGTIQISNNQVVFLPNTPHQAGDQLMITLRGIQDSQNNSYDDQSWIEYAPVTNTTSAKFGSVFTGITLPTEAMNYSYHLSNADLNQDGLNDIIFRYHSAYGQPTKVLTYLQNTNQTFAAPTTYQNSYSHSNLGGTPDLNNDGFPDLVLTHNVPSRLHIRLNNGDGTFSNPTYYTTTNYVNQVDFGDIDQDGDIDVVTHSGNASLSANTFSVFKNNGDGTFQSQQTTSTGIFGGGLELGDLDNDGDLDIVYTSSTSFNSGKFFRVYENNGSGGFSLFSSEANPSDLRINNLIDLNDDGNLDVILRRYSSEVIYGTGDLSSISITNAMAFSNENIDIRPGDIDGDNDIDLFNNRTNDGSGWTTLPYRKYLNQGSATFNLVTENIPLGERQSQFMSDVDRDNDLDLLYVTSDRKIHYLLNQVTSLIADTTEIEVNDNVQFTYQIADMGTTNELRFGDGNTMNLTTSSGTISHAYSNEGVYYVSIYIDNVLADKIAILVKSCDFSGFVSSTNGYREANEERCDFIQSGVARIPPALSSVSYYWTNLNSFKNFNLSGDNAGMEVRVKNPSSGGGISCYDTRIVIYGDQGVAQVSFMTTGCSFYSSMTAGNTSVNGSNTNLTALAQNLSNWHTIKLETQNDTAKAFYDGDEKYALNYTGMVGNILGVRVTFKGSGSVDWIKLYDGTGSIAFEEEFDECSQTYYADTDGDSYGDPNVSLQSCESPIGYVTNADDCDDSDPNLNIQNGCTTCNDGIQNGDETGVDCGGSCPPCTGNNNCPDLIFENITFNNSTSYSYTFKNIGYSNIDLFGSGSTYSDNIVIQNILSLDSIYGNADDFGGGGSVIPGPPGTILTPGDTYSGNYQLALNGNTANYAFIIIDWGNKFLECFEDNNVVVIPLNGSRAWDQCDFINLNINHNPILSSTYKVQNSIVSDGKIYPSAIVTFQAENDILLKPGFQATEGSDFHGFLSACNLPSLFTIPADSSSTLENNTTKDRTNRQGDYPRLDQNIPNPFRSTTIIPYYVPLKSRSAQINIYNILGQFVGTQKIQNFGEGYVEYTINNLPDGIYFYALIVDKKIMGVKKMTIQNE